VNLIYKGRRVLLKHHRLLNGAHPHPPNSVSALRAVLAGRAEAIEFDVRLTNDGVFVLVHDATLDRETTGSGPVRQVSSREMAALRLRHTDEAPATLAEVVAVLREHRHPVKVQIDMCEESPLTNAAAATLVDHAARARANPAVRIVLGCEDADKLLAFRKIDPSIQVGLDVTGPYDAPEAEVARRLGLLDDVSEYYMPKPFVLQAIARGFNPVAFVHEQKPGALVDVWTFYADEPDIARTLWAALNAGADQITTPAAIHLLAIFNRG
jgi:glycerophosphoryl diester phosphodiesterase